MRVTFLIVVNYGLYRFELDPLIALYAQIASDLETGRKAPSGALAWTTEIADLGGFYIGEFNELLKADPSLRKQVDHVIDEDEFDPLEEVDRLRALQTAVKEAN